MEFWFATGNKGKVAEYKLLLKEFPQILTKTQSDLSSFSTRPEDGKTFQENALIKARTLRSIRNQDWVLGEDSGIEVEGLGNLPGIHSARYAGPKASDNENVTKLLKMMQIRAVQNRDARFVCSLVVFSPTGEQLNFEGVMTGTISKAPAGMHGFGYDSIFIPTGETKTLAELGSGYKVTKSHRAQAFQKFLVQFKETST